MDDLELAILFHETYERLAPSFGYETRLETREFDENSKNGKLMVAVCGEVLRHLAPMATDYDRAGLLACTVCYKILPANEMYSVDACSEMCQSKIVAPGEPHMILGAWSAGDLRRAFVAGVAWWEYHSQMATLWPSDRDEAEAEAERQYPGGRLPVAADVAHCECSEYVPAFFISGAPCANCGKSPRG